MKATLQVIPTALILFSVATRLGQDSANQQQQPEFIKQGQQLMREGKLEGALALYRQTLQTSPDSRPANIAAGSVLDLMGKKRRGP
jgi:thioredoxin-like negative regulator of GroEL